VRGAALSLVPAMVLCSTSPPTDDPSGGADRVLTLSIQRDPSADDPGYEVEVGTGPAVWLPATTLVPTTNNGDGSASVVYRDNNPSNAERQDFIRLRVTLNP